MNFLLPSPVLCWADQGSVGPSKGGHGFGVGEGEFMYMEALNGEGQVPSCSSPLKVFGLTAARSAEMSALGLSSYHGIK